MKNILYILYTLSFVIGLEDTGRLNNKYQIKNYYGSRYLSTFLPYSFLTDDPTLVYWSNGQFIQEYNSDQLYIAEPYDHTIKVLKENVVHILLGKSNKAGYVDGDAENAVLNHPSAVVVYNSTDFPNTELLTPKFIPMLFKSNSIQCLYATYVNYSSCVDSSYNPLPNSTTLEIERELIKLINTNTFDDSTIKRDENIMFIADTNNHCIRKVDLVTAEVSTYAGVCTKKGFKDGNRGTNLFNLPTGIGIDDYGNVYVYDSGNSYMRVIYPSGVVATMLNGACYQYTMKDNIKNKFGFKSTTLLCFKNWIKTYGKPNEHIYIAGEDNTCYDNIVKCSNYSSNLT